jgi:hypothetical protein
MTSKSFTAQVENAAKRIEGDMLKVMVNSIQDVMEGAMTPQLAISKGATSFEIGKIPVADAELINSLTSDGIKGATSYVTALARLKIGQIMRFAWTAEHAPRIEYGFKGTDSLGRYYNQAGRYFVGHNAAKFPEFVEKWKKVIFK